MALIYPTIWEQGDKREQLIPGYHYKKNVQSLVVPEGQVVTFYKNEDRRGWKSLPFNEGAYHHLYFHGVETRPGLIHVEENDLKSLDLIVVGWDVAYDKNDKSKKFTMRYSLPIGDRVAGEDFPNDKIEWIDIPFGVTAEVFDDKEPDKDSGSLIFSGNKQGGLTRIWLYEYNYHKLVSCIKIRADDWVQAGIAIEDEEIVDGEMTAATTEISNNSPHKATCSKEINATFEESMQENWNVEAGVTAKAEFEAQTGPVKTTLGAEVSFSAGYGESKTKAENKGFSDVASVELEGHGNAKVSMIVEYGEIVGTAVRKWRNKRNNVIIEQRGSFKCRRGNRSRIEIH